eukprot:13083701-Alexandrium_andersonii.AAC.1
MFVAITAHDAAVTLWSVRLRGWLLTACLQIGSVVEVVASRALEVGSTSIGLGATLISTSLA